jgi:hypothetical protein
VRLRVQGSFGAKNAPQDDKFILRAMLEELYAKKSVGGTGD